MTATARGRVAIAALTVVLAFGAAFAVRKATAGAANAPPLPAPVVLSPAPVRVSGLALPAAPPALRRPPHPTAPAQSAAPSPTSAPAAPAPAAPSTPAAPPSSGGKGSGPVLVG